jgi:hypothetical protein
MSPTETKLESRHESEPRFLNVAVHVIRAKGYSATRIEDICEAAGLTKAQLFPSLRQQGSAGPRQRVVGVNFESNCKLSGKQNGKSANDGAKALCHDELPSGMQREQPFHQHCGSRCKYNEHAEAQSWSILRRFTLDCDHSVEIDADESRSGNAARECGRQIGKSSKAFKRDSMRATISPTHNQYQL